MIKVEQQEVGKKTGDCMRASIASVLEVELQTVPHITRISERKWFPVMYYFFIAHEYKYCGFWYPKQGRRKLLKKHSFDGHYLASVNSRTYPVEDGITHMVVIDSDLNIVHDPHPEKKWQGESLKGSADLKSVYKFRKMTDTDKEYWHYL